MTCSFRTVAAAPFVLVAALAPAIALAQTTPATPPGPATVPTGPAQPPGPGSMTYAPPPSGISYGNPQSPNGTIGGGNATESSAHPVTGDAEDSFDLGHQGGAGGSVHGDETGPIFIGGPTYGGETPYSHVVRRGDTLWGISGYYFQNPYQWPRVWSYNPQIRNPNWIYPGDEVRLKDGGGSGGGGSAGPPVSQVPLPYQGMNLVDRRRQVPNGTVFLRDQGWIRDPNDEVWGDITGSAEDKMFLSDFDEIYLHIDKGHDVHLGQELTIFLPIKVSAAGTIVQINGTARIDQWNAQDRVARAQIVESLNVIERGARIGPLARRFEIVPPKRNDVEVQAHVVASIHPNVFYGQNQVVFIDKGEEAGLKVGNRLFILRRGDAWRRSLVTGAAGRRVSPDAEKPLPALEDTPGSRQDAQNYPDEVVGELRVVALKKDSATCVVTVSKSEIEQLDLAVARKGY
ncbi:MAG TPA: LysM peptidoglycan-binding domain-containing protein [Polyangiaceae bacterium]